MYVQLKEGRTGEELKLNLPLAAQQGRKIQQSGKTVLDDVDSNIQLSVTAQMNLK